MEHNEKQYEDIRNPGELLPTGKLAFVCVFLSLIVCNYLSFGFGMMLPMLKEDMLAGSRSAGLLSSVSFFTLLIAQLPAAAVAVRLHPKVSMGLSFLCLAGGCLCYSIATSVWQLVLGRMLLAFHICSLGGAVQMLKGEWVPRDKILGINSAQEFSSNLGHTMGTFFAPLMLSIFLSWRRASCFCLLAASLIAIIWFCFYRDIKDCRKKNGDSNIRFFTLAIRRKTVRLLALGWPGAAMIWVAFNSFWPSYALDHTALDYSSAGLAVGMIPIGSVAATLAAAPLTRLIHRDKLIICGWGALLPLFYGATLLTDNLIALCILFFLAGFSSFAYVPVAMSRLWKLPDITAPLVAAGTSLIMLSSNLGSALIGVIYDYLTVYFTQKAALALCCLSPLLWFFSTVFLPEPEEDIFQ